MSYLFEFNPVYLQGKIYRVYSERLPNMQYIGSTTQPLCVRFQQHKKSHNKTIRKLMEKYDDVVIELIETYPCFSLTELTNKEQYYIDDTRNEHGIVLNIATASARKPDKTPLCLIEWYIEQKPQYTTMLKYIILRDY